MRSPNECPHDFTSGGTGILTTCCQCGMEMEPAIGIWRGMTQPLPAGLDVRASNAEALRRSADSYEARLTDQPLSVTDDSIQRAKQIIAGPVRAAGYRLKVLLLESDKGLSAGEAQIAPTLAASGFIGKSDNQKSREDRGSDNALIVDVGPAAWCQKQALGPEPWAKVGMVIKIIRYTGHSFEEPPGSGKRYALINDEDVMGYYEELVNE